MRTLPLLAFLPLACSSSPSTSDPPDAGADTGAVTAPPPEASTPAQVQARAGDTGADTGGDIRPDADAILDADPPADAGAPQDTSDASPLADAPPPPPDASTPPPSDAAPPPEASTPCTPLYPTVSPSSCTCPDVGYPTPAYLCVFASNIPPSGLCVGMTLPGWESCTACLETFTCGCLDPLIRAADAGMTCHPGPAARLADGSYGVDGVEVTSP
jgi:hypothetical protein